MAIAGIPAWRVGALALSFLCLIPGTALLWRVSYEISNNSPGTTRQGDYFVFLYLLIGAMQALSTFVREPVLLWCAHVLLGFSHTPPFLDVRS